MPTFEWKGRDRAGRAQSGVLVADSKEAVLAVLRRQQMVPVAVKEKGKEIALPRFRKGIDDKTLAVFTRQFSVMIDAGLPLVQCLQILGEQQEHKAFQRIIMQVREDVEAGSSLASALAKHPSAFNDLYVNMVAAGEAGGILDTILQRLAVYIEKAARLKAQVKSAMIYPVTVIVIAIIVVYIILWKVIPVFASLFASLGADLPLPTRIVVALSHFIGRFWWLILLSVVALTVMINRYYKTPQGKMVIDRLLLKAPVVGLILRKIAVARFCRTLGTLMSAGVPLLESLDITARTSGNAVIEQAIMEVRKQVEEGKTLSEPLGATQQFPPMVVHMISVGESTGALDTMLGKIAEFYEEEVDIAVAGMMKLIEPVMIFVLGVVIGGIVISMYLPMFDLIAKIG
jgi:type IV pilus assembly protein PilC